MPITVSVSPAKANALNSQARKRGWATDADMACAMLCTLVSGWSLSTDATALRRYEVAAEDSEGVRTRMLRKFMLIDDSCSSGKYTCNFGRPCKLTPSVSATTPATSQ